MPAHYAAESLSNRDVPQRFKYQAAPLAKAIYKTLTSLKWN